MENKAFDQWAIVEIMGHQRYAGHVTEQVVAGTAMLRVDVPQIGELPAFTKLFGGSSIYAITPVTEETARAAAAQARQQPVSEWSAKEMLGIGNRRQASFLDGDNEEDDHPY